jgi:hypothetical protein
MHFSLRCNLGASGSDLRGIAFSTGAIGGAKILGGGCGKVVKASAGVPGSVPLGVADDAGRSGPTSGVTYGGASSARRLRGAREGEAISFPFPFPFGTREPYAGGGVISANAIVPGIGPSVRKAAVAGESGSGVPGGITLPVEYRIGPCEGGGGGGGGGGGDTGDGELTDTGEVRRPNLVSSPGNGVTPAWA